MRPVFPHHLVVTPAADPHRQAHRDAPGQALAPAATPEQRYAMPPAAPAGNAAPGTRDQAEPSGTRAPAPVTPGHAPRKAWALLPRRADRRAQTALPAAARSDRTSTARAEISSERLRRTAGLLRRAPKIRASYYDPLFERPDLIEDDYYRLRNQPRS